MKILAIDLSCQYSSIALFQKAEMNIEIFFHQERDMHVHHSAQLFYLLEAAMELYHPEKIVVGLGPGSYSGLRLSITVAQAIATALQIPLYAISSLLSWNIKTDHQFLAVGNAYGGSYWLAHILDESFLVNPYLIPLNSLTQEFLKYPGINIYSTASLPSIKSWITKPDIIKLGVMAINTEPCSQTPEPIYLKPPHITYSSHNHLK